MPIFHKESLSIFRDDKMSPAPFVLIDDFLTTEEQAIIWNTIDNYKDKFINSSLDNIGVDTRIRKSKVLLKKDIKNIAAFFLPKVADVIANNFNNLFLDFFNVPTKEIQLPLHTNGHFFSVHKDTAGKGISRGITFVYYFHQIPKDDKGRDLILFDTNKTKDIFSNDYTRVVTKNNLLILFPSYYYHQVTPVIMANKDYQRRRFTLNGWFSKRAKE